MTGSPAPPKTARILIVAGSDSGGGAGIQADIKTVTMLGGHAMTAITAITAQNTLGVQAVHAIPADMVVAQMRSCINDIGVDAVKIGMIGSAATAHAVAEVLETLDLPTVFDPVMVATSGSVLADADTIAAFERLMRLATIVTPNTIELSAMAGIDVTDELTQSEAAEILMARSGCRAVLAKGGHLRWAGYTIVSDDRGEPVPRANDARVFDCLYEKDSSGWRERAWDNARRDTRHTHGTGCTLASGIACGLAQGLDLRRAVGRSIAYVQAALAAAPGLGQGHGPLGHALGVIPFDEIEG